MALKAPLCYNRTITKRGNMDYENDYDLMQDVHEQIMWEESVEAYMEDIDIMPDDPEFYED
tara:strand:- start:767 stop:949 length:183 start_codon:yes stop_codon:yes gene_type:complete